MEEGGEEEGEKWRVKDEGGRGGGRRGIEGEGWRRGKREERNGG